MEAGGIPVMVLHCPLNYVDIKSIRTKRVKIEISIAELLIVNTCGTGYAFPRSLIRFSIKVKTICTLGSPFTYEGNFFLGGDSGQIGGTQEMPF